MCVSYQQDTQFAKWFSQKDLSTEPFTTLFKKLYERGSFSPLKYDREESSKQSKINDDS